MGVSKEKIVCTVETLVLMLNLHFQFNEIKIYHYEQYVECSILEMPKEIKRLSVAGFSYSTITKNLIINCGDEY